MNTLAALHLAKSFKKRQVVKNVSVTISSGQVVGLLGPNGAGKTTCFYMIVGLVPSDAGKVTLNQKEITRLPVHGRARAGIGYLPQEPSIFRKLTVKDNIMAILQTRSDLTRKEREGKLDELLQEFHVTHISNNLGISLSGGERRRVELARALAMEPSFLLLDEPFTGVDPISINDIQQIIKHLVEKQIGVLITDHNVRETLTICDKAYIINEGAVLAEGDANSILANQQVKDVYLGHEFRL